MSAMRRWPSYQELRAQVELLSAAVVGGHIQKVRDPDPRSVALKIRVPGQTLFLILSGDPDRGRVEVSLDQPPTLPQPTGIGRWVRAHLAGKRIEALTLAPDDRIVTLTTPRGSLCLELLPHAPNLYTLSMDGRVMGWSKRIPSRGLSLGKPWVAPERPDHLILGQEQARGGGVTPQISSELIERGTRAERDADSISLSSEEPHRAWGEDQHVTSTHGSLTRDEALDAIREQLGQTREGSVDDNDGLKDARACRKLLKQTRARLERLSKALWSDLERADHAQEWLEEGELLKSQLATLKRGMTEITVTDWYDPDMGSRVITLDPKLDGIENVERRFQRHRKALRGADIAAERLAVVEDQLSAISELEERFREGPLDDLRAALVALGVYRAKQKRRGAQQQTARLPYRVFWSAHGEKIWLGKGGMDNHLTSFQAARGQDLWVHTRDVPGAHVIIPLPHRGHVPQYETILDAAALAVHHSKQRGEESVELYFTERKHIRPVPGGPPGKVMVASSKTIIAEDVSARITRLYTEAERREALKN